MTSVSIHDKIHANCILQAYRNYDSKADRIMKKYAWSVKGLPNKVKV